jgi:hypothetical protein
MHGGVGGANNFMYQRRGSLVGWKLGVNPD